MRTALKCSRPNRKIRDVVRKELGEKLHVICLDMEVEDMENRVRARHAGDENSVEMFKTVYRLFEPVGEDEPNCSEVKVSPSMTPEDVAQIVLQKINATKEDSHL